jgi:hypothetical protein
MMLLEHDDDPVAERVRIALRQIATDGLRGDPVVAPIRARRHWVRPATIAAALVLVAALVATVVALRSGSERTVVDGGTAPVRIIPAPIPAGMHVYSVREFDRQDLLESSNSLPQQVWIRWEEGRVVAMVQLRVSEGGETFEVPGARVSVTPMTECGAVWLIASNVPDDVFDAMNASITCRSASGEPMASAEPPRGFEAVAPTEILPAHWTIAEATGNRRRASFDFAVSSFPADSRALISGSPGWEVDHIAGRDVLVNVDRKTYSWEVTDDVWVNLSGIIDLTEEEVAAFIEGTRVVSEAEWQEWLATVEPDSGPDGLSEGIVTATTAAVASTLPAR